MSTGPTLYLLAVGFQYQPSTQCPEMALGTAAHRRPTTNRGEEVLVLCSVLLPTSGCFPHHSSIGVQKEKNLNSRAAQTRFKPLTDCVSLGKPV